jgi:hypothetical protein
MSALHGVDQKIRRARALLSDLTESIGSALSEHPQRFAFDSEPQDGEYVMRVFDVPVIDTEWRLVIGEILYNLRSALDQLAWQLIILAGKQPNERTQFPIRDTPFNDAGDLVGAELRPTIHHAGIRAAVEEVQPYRGVQGEPHPFNLSPLWKLHRLNIIDKHRLLLVVASVFSWDEMWYGWNDSYGTNPRIRVNLGPLKDSAPVAWFTFNGDPPPNFDPHPSLHVSLYEGEMPDLIDKSITDVLETLCWWVENHIVEWRFRPLFP